MKVGFDHNEYISEQSKYIKEVVNGFDKLYIEFGGKLLNDLHAKRVLPGFDPKAKIKLLQELKENAEIIICVYAGDIERNRIRGDYGITYDQDVFREIDELRSYGLSINSVVITRYSDQAAVKVFINKLKQRNIKTYIHFPTKGYPTDVDTIVSSDGYGKNPYIETTKSIVVVTGPGSGSGKLGTCLSQLYHEYKLGKKAGYKKFETFPVWNLPLKHPVNVAYEAATVDIKDVNMIDSFHLEAYNTIAVNYNRDIEMFPVIKRIIEKISGKESIYKSPTDMGVNRIKSGIINEDIVIEASNQEIIRRYMRTKCEYKKGICEDDILERMQLIMEDSQLKVEDRKVVVPAREYMRKKQQNKKEVLPVMAMELPDGTIITGKESSLMKASAAMVINAIKHIANISDAMYLISPVILEPILRLKDKNLHHEKSILDLEEVLIALSISAATNPMAQIALDQLPLLVDSQAHSTVMLSAHDEQVLKRLGIDITCDDEFPSVRLYY